MRDASFASLSPTLLARKGAARPAMRPQVQPLNSHELHGRQPHHPQDDLGWNDMGEAANESGADKPKAEVIAFTGKEPIETPIVADKPAVLEDREEAVEKVSKPRLKAAAQGRRAAFTLRIDPERHLKLRLACTLRDTSAQQLLTEALDHYLEAQDDIAELADRVGRREQTN